eukprot:Rhum_TRINITY_DN20676_c0_g1::Rhum_TRINITY_DN20676_c0_g1_i1::g.171765::m.171765
MGISSGQPLIEDAAAHGRVPENRRSVLLVLRTRLDNLRKVLRVTDNATAVPHSEFLEPVGDDVDGDLRLALALVHPPLEVHVHAVVDLSLDVPLQTLAEVPEHRGSAGQDNVLVQALPGVDRAAGDHLVNEVGERRRVLEGEDLRVEEELGAEELLGTHVNLPCRLRLRNNSRPLLDVLRRLGVVLREFLRNVGAHVPVLLLDALRLQHHVHLRVRHLTVLDDVEDELGDVLPRKADVLDARLDDVSLVHRDDVRHAVTGVDHSSGQRALADSSLLGGFRAPGGGKGQDGLHRDVEPRDAEGLEHNLRRVFPVLGGVVRGLCQDEGVLLRLAPQVLVDALLPQLLHLVPVLHHAVLHGAVLLVLLTRVASHVRSVGSDVEVKVVQRTLLCLRRRLRNAGGENEVRLVAARVSDFCVPRTVVHDNRWLRRHLLQQAPLCAARCLWPTSNEVQIL